MPCLKSRVAAYTGTLRTAFQSPGGVWLLSVSSIAGIAAELVAMAVDILHVPESGLRRSALAHAVKEVIRAEGDAPLLRAIEVAPDLHVARVIRAAAEAACEVISVVANGTEGHAGLFSVPFVVGPTAAARVAPKLSLKTVEAAAQVAATRRLNVLKCDAYNRGGKDWELPVVRSLRPHFANFIAALLAR